MARIKIKIPQKKLHETLFCVRIDDINYGNHMSNDAFLRYAHEVRLQYLKSIDASEMNFQGSGLIMSDCAVVYKSEAFHGDSLEAKLFVDDINDYGFDFVYEIINKSTKKQVAIITTGMVFFNYDERKIAKTPESVKQLFN